MKKYLAVVLAVIITVSVLPLGVMANTSGDYTYEVLSETEKTCVITKYSGRTRNLEIPSTLDGYTVVELGAYSFYKDEDATGNKDLRSVVVPSSVKKIGKYAFAYCSGLNTVTLPDGINILEEGAFFDCQYLGTINFPDSITYIGRNVLCNTKLMPLLEQYDREDPAPPETEPIYDMSKWTGGALYIGKHLMCVDLTKTGSFSVKEGTKTIAGEAFYWCDKLTSITIPNGVVSIGEYAFYNCDKIKTLYLPDSITTIGTSAFDSCDILQTINIPSGVKEISDWAFAGCKALKSVTIPATVKRVGVGAYCSCTALTTLKVNSGVEEIDKAAFSGCTALSSVTVADSVKLIGQNAFGSTKFYSTSSNWKNNALYTGNHLLSVRASVSGAYSVPAGTKAISEDAFFQCANITQINIPKSVTGIYDGAFRKCTALKNITVAGDNGLYTAQSGVLYSKDLSKLICCPVSNTAVTMNLTNNVKSIADYAFYANKNLVTVKLVPSVNSIGEYAFYDCNNLNGVDIPASVKYIGDWAFAASEKVIMYVYSDSYAENYAKQNEIRYDYLGITLEDTANGVTVMTDTNSILPSNSKLNIKISKVTDGTKYTIEVESNGANVTPNGSVTVKIRVPSGVDASSCKIYGVSGDDYTFISTTTEGGYLVFKTTKLGDFLVTTKALTAIPGDANGDGRVTAFDARIVLQIASGSREVTEEERALLDTNNDGKITAIDARNVLRLAAGA